MRIGIRFALMLLAVTSGIAVGAPPTLRGPLPDTATKGVLVWNTSAAGYVAEEYLVSGLADVNEPVAMADAANMLERNNVHDMGQRDFTVKTLKAAQPYTTRIVVYRPADPKRFSGNVIFETFHPLGGGTGIVWAQLNAYFIARGDAYVGVQHPSTFAGLIKADASRYGELSMVDNTQLWGSIAQVGALVKAGAPTSPLHQYAVKHLFLTGYSFTGVATSTFANWYHASAKLADGRPVFDGYVSNANSMYNRPIGVPVMRMNTQSDFDSFGGLGNRREDSDVPDSRYRLYEVAGAAHVTRPVTPASGAVAPKPPAAAVPAANQPAFSPAKCAAAFPAGAQPNMIPVHVVIEAMFDNMFRWVDGVAPPRAPRIETNTDGSTRKDADGNALGGLRLPSMAVPAATYDVGHGDDCFLYGYQIPFTAERLKALYGTAEVYAGKVKKASEQDLAEHWLRPDAVDEFTKAATQSVKF
jgi:Alpha/beta hydrolase domain